MFYTSIWRRRRRRNCVYVYMCVYFVQSHMYISFMCVCSRYLTERVYEGGKNNDGRRLVLLVSFKAKTMEREKERKKKRERRWILSFVLHIFFLMDENIMQIRDWKFLINPMDIVTSHAKRKINKWKRDLPILFFVCIYLSCYLTSLMCVVYIFLSFSFGFFVYSV